MSGDVRYTFAAIVDQEDVDETWVPRVVDKSGTVAWDPADGEPKSFRATGLTVYRGSPNSDGRLLKVDGVSINVHVTGARIVAVCRKYDKGGGWFGGLTAMVVFNAVSKARAAMRSHGKFLVGQMRWPWLSDVGYTEKTGWLSDNQLRLVAMDDGGAWVFADFKLPKDVNARAVAERILASAAAARGTDEIPTLPKYDPQSKKFALVGLPGAKKALASTAYPSANGATPPDTSADRPQADERKASPVVEAAAAAAQPPAPSPAARCAECGEEAAEGARFCRFCGGQIVTEPASMQSVKSEATSTGPIDAQFSDADEEGETPAPSASAVRAQQTPAHETEPEVAPASAPKDAACAGAEFAVAGPAAAATAADVRRCGDCGREATTAARFCRFCGGPVAARPPVAEDGALAESRRESSAPSEVSPAKAPVAVRPEPHTRSDNPASQQPACSKCGAPSSPEHRFCRTCGHTLVAPATEGLTQAAPAVVAAPPRVARTSRPGPSTASAPVTAPLGVADTSTDHRSRKPLLIGALLLVLVLAGGGAYVVLGQHKDSKATANARHRQAPAGETASTPTVSQPATTPAATPTADATLLPDGPPDQFADDIRTLLIDFHQAIVDRDYRAAWKLLSARKRSKELREDGYPKWRSAQASLTPYLDPTGLDVTVRNVNRQTGVALVDVSGMTWSGPHAHCSEWAGLTWAKYEAGEWRYDPGYSTTPQRKRDWKKRYHELLGASC